MMVGYEWPLVSRRGTAFVHFGRMNQGQSIAVLAFVSIPRESEPNMG